jgi:diguanylate cyclase (GGDEF)-like protein
MHEANQLAVLKAKDEVERVNEQLSALALTDGLTGLANRRRFDAMLNVEFSRAVRNNTPLTLAMVDVDFFKQYNDAYGHVKGDECLRIIAEVLSEVLSRPTDLVARYGGEEFSLILPTTNLQGGTLIAEGIIQAIKQRHIPHQGSEWGLLTVSIGIACTTPGPSDSAEELLNAADNALYVAKDKGRNRIQSFAY